MLSRQIQQIVNSDPDYAAIAPVIEKEANRPDLPRDKMHIDVCAIPSFDVNMRGLLNHYNVPVPTEGLLFPVPSPTPSSVASAAPLRPRNPWAHAIDGTSSTK
jgi:hypothetical protein